MAVFALVVKNLNYPVKGFDVPVDHYAIFNTDTDTVVHNSPEHPGVKEVSSQSFWDKYFAARFGDLDSAVSAGALVITPAEEASATIWQRAKQRIGAAYERFSYNC